MSYNRKPSLFRDGFLMAPSSSGLGRRPLKAEVAGSNPVGATIFSPVYGIFLSFNNFPYFRSDIKKGEKKANCFQTI